MARLTRTRLVLAVPDLARSAAFYRDALGFTVREIGDPGWRFFERDGQIIMAGECVDATPAGEIGDHSYCSYVDVEGIEEYFAQVLPKLAAAGGGLIKQLRTEPWGMREFGVRTVDGHRLMFGEQVR